MIVALFVRVRVSARKQDQLCKDMRTLVLALAESKFREALP
jgi:hypothetical protein